MKIRRMEDKNDCVMTWDDTFSFRCSPSVDCYNSCCADVTIFLNPLDVGRLRTALGMTSTDFLERYTVRLHAESTGLPAVVLKMTDDQAKRCPFVTEAGCSVYEARPYSCRLYPLDTENGVEYRFIVDGKTCHGLVESEEWTVERWRKEQGLREYDEIDHELKDVMSAETLWEAPIKDERMKDMMYLALYDPDRFREFVFDSSFLRKFNIEGEIIDRIRESDTDLLFFAAQWLRFALFGKKGFLKIDKEYLERKKREVLQAQRSEK